MKMKRKMKWFGKIWAILVIVGMLACCLPEKAEAATGISQKFGETVVVQISSGAAGLWDLKTMDNQSAGWFLYQPAKNGILHLEILEMDELIGLCASFGNPDAAAGERMYGLKAGDIVSIGAKSGTQVGLKFACMGNGSENKNYSGLLKFKVTFEENGHAEVADDTASLNWSSWFGDWPLWTQQAQLINSNYNLTGAAKSISIDDTDCMYTGYLHGRKDAPEGVYTAANYTNVDDVDRWSVVLKRGQKAKIYINDFVALRNTVEKGSLSIKISTPSETIEGVEGKLQYDTDRQMYYYPLTAQEQGTYEIFLGGYFGRGINVQYQIGVYCEKQGWYSENGKEFWYEGGVLQGTEGRGKEIYDPDSDAWYWLDSIQGGAKAVAKDVYQESSGGKWVRYDSMGRMVKGWDEVDGNRYYFDLQTGAMFKGYHTIEGVTYYFDEVTGIGQKEGWVTIDGKDYWYEKGVRQGTEGRGKEIYDPDSDAWYWLDSVQNGAKAVSKDVYQESSGGKWVRYNARGGMIKGFDTNRQGTYYFDPTTGAMAKGWVWIGGRQYYFDETTGIMLR